MENTTDQVKTFTVKATYLNGQTIVATGVGAVNNFLPHTKRGATLLLDGDPSTASSSTVAVDTLISSDDSTAESDAAQKFTFGPPTIGTIGLEVQVTNGDSATHTLTVGCSALRNGVLAAVGSGAINDIAAGQTKTVTILMSGEPKASDEFLLYVETMVE
jgi:hypothetical protein